MALRSLFALDLYHHHHHHHYYYYYYYYYYFASLLIWLEREKNNALLPKTDYTDKERGHDRRLYLYGHVPPKGVVILNGVSIFERIKAYQIISSHLKLFAENLHQKIP